MPVEPPPCPWRWPNPLHAPTDLVAFGADLQPGTLLAAYRAGLFPMPFGEAAPGEDEQPLGWWCPDPRGILPIDGLRISHSLRASCRRYEVRVDTTFHDVVAACADPARPQGWITDAVQAAYVELHQLGWAHSVEAWSLDDGILAGGLYGVAIGGLFAGESMFHRRRDASKVALVGLTSLLWDRGYLLHDVQWLTPHLARMGAVEVPRAQYLRLLRQALRVDAAPLHPLPTPLRW